MYRAADQRPFDVSLDSLEHYFLRIGIDLSHFEHELESVRIAGRSSLIKIYEQGPVGGNKEKVDEYRRKLGVLSSLGD